MAKTRVQQIPRNKIPTLKLEAQISQNASLPTSYITVQLFLACMGLGEHRPINL